MSPADDYDAWLAAPGPRRRRNTATTLYLDYRAWLGAVERRAKQRQFMLGRLKENRLLPAHLRAALLSLHDTFASFSLRIELALERFRRRLPKGRQHDVLQEVRKREVLGENRFQGGIKVHQGLSGEGATGDDAESAGSGNRPADGAGRRS